MEEGYFKFNVQRETVSYLIELFFHTPLQVSCKMHFLELLSCLAKSYVYRFASEESPKWTLRRRCNQLLVIIIVMRWSISLAMRDQRMDDFLGEFLWAFGSLGRLYQQFFVLCGITMMAFHSFICRFESNVLRVIIGEVIELCEDSPQDGIKKSIETKAKFICWGINYTQIIAIPLGIAFLCVPIAFDAFIIKASSDYQYLYGCYYVFNIFWFYLFGLHAAGCFFAFMAFSYLCIYFLSVQLKEMKATAFDALSSTHTSSYQIQSILQVGDWCHQFPVPSLGCNRFFILLTKCGLCFPNLLLDNSLLFDNWLLHYGFFFHCGSCLFRG